MSMKTTCINRCSLYVSVQVITIGSVLILWLHLVRVHGLPLWNLRRHTLWSLHWCPLRCTHHDRLLSHRLLIHHLLSLRWLLHHHWLTHHHWLLHLWGSLHLHRLSLHHRLLLVHWLSHHLLRLGLLLVHRLSHHLLGLRLLLVHWLWLWRTDLDTARILYDAIWILHDWLLLHWRYVVYWLLLHWRWTVYWLALRNLRLVHEQDWRITRINQSKLLLELLWSEFLGKLLLCLLIRSNHLHVVSNHAQETLTTTFSKPNLEWCVSWQRVVQRFTFSFPVVRAEYWLLKFLLECICVWQVECFAATLILIIIDQNEPASSQNQPSTSTQFTHAINFDLKLDPFPV